MNKAGGWNPADGSYFAKLMCNDKRAHAALENLVDDLHSDKERTINSFLCHSGSEDFLWALVKLLGSEHSRVAGNAAYIIGTLAESELGCYRVLSLTKGRHGECQRILWSLTNMLTFDDAESVMNAAGTMGTLAESHEGRQWMLSESCIGQTIDHVTDLLHADNLWTASNAALVLARLSISEQGCTTILAHQNGQRILSKLVTSLGVDEAGRGMNAAFAVGRLCDLYTGRKRVLSLPDSERMISSLAKMLCCQDPGASKNACFALSCLATNAEGHSRLLNNYHSDEVLRQLSELLCAEDGETGWFAAMTLRTLASQPKGCLRLRDNQCVLPALRNVDKLCDINPDLKEEVLVTLDILKRLNQPGPLSIEVKDPHTAEATWEPVTTKCGFDVYYHLFEGTHCIYSGKETSYNVENLHPSSQYSFKVRASTEGDESPFSDTVHITMEETVPGPPLNPQVLGCTITQLKVSWEPPEESNGVLKGYYIYQGATMVEHTIELMCIVTGLQPSTTYEIEICASTSKGKGPKTCIIGKTAEIGAHAPSKPDVMVLGRNELHVTWKPPEVPFGRITRYDLTMNGKTIYSGKDLSFTVRRLTPDTEYSFVVSALTNEGRFESKSLKKRTAKDEYEVPRPPLYQTPVKKEEEPPKPSVVEHKKKKSISLPQDGKSVPRMLSASSKKNERGGQVSTEDQISRDWKSNEWRAEDSIAPTPKMNKGSRSSSFGVVRKDDHRSSSSPSPTKGSNSESSSGRECVMGLPIEKQSNSSLTKSVFPLSMDYIYGNADDDNGNQTQNGHVDSMYSYNEQSNLNMHLSNGSGTRKMEKSKTTLSKRDLDKRQGFGGHRSPKRMSTFVDNHDSDGEVQHTEVWSMGSLSLSPPKGAAEYYQQYGIDMKDSLRQEIRSYYPSYYRPKEWSDLPWGRQEMLFTPGPPPGRARAKTWHPNLRLPDLSERTNTFINYHRPIYKKERLSAKHPQLPSPYAGPSTWAPPMDKLENKVPRMHNKFVPMQFRTQPSNLSVGQIQRMNTQVLDSRGIGGMNLRRIESFGRSLTQADLRTLSQHPMETPSQAGIREQDYTSALNGQRPETNHSEIHPFIMSSVREKHNGGEKE